MKRQIELLQHENTLLRNEKYCRWCRKSYLPTVCLAHTATPKSANLKESPMEAEFEKPDLFGSKGEQKKGRIWIAVGLLMLVLGLSLYGVRGEGSYVRQI
jgi:hypothetical protein